MYSRRIPAHSLSSIKAPVPSLQDAKLMMGLMCIVYFAIWVVTELAMDFGVRRGALTRLPQQWRWLSESTNLIIAAAVIGFAANVALIAKFLPTSTGRAVVVVIFKWAMASVLVLPLAGATHIHKTQVPARQRARTHTSLDIRDAHIEMRFKQVNQRFAPALLFLSRR
jgi:hypothetical protein